MAVIVVYGGGFQPFHVGHLSSYLQAKKAFPEAAFYVAASNDTKTRPIPFNDKQFLAQQAGVVDPFVEVKLPIRPHEILDKYNPEQDIFVLIRSERDPVGYTKKDGSPGYYQPFENLESCAPFATHGYVFVTKKQVFKLNGQEVYSGTQVRDMYSNSDDQGKIKIISQLYPKSKQQKMIKKLLDKYLSNTQPMDLPKPNAIKKLKQKQLAETISKIRPLLKEASIEKKLKFLKLMKSTLSEGVPSTFEKPSPTYREPAWSFTEIAQKLGITPNELIGYRNEFGFPKKIEGIKSGIGSKAYFRQSEVKRWVNDTDIRNIIKSKRNSVEESRIIDPQMVDVYYRPVKDSRGKRIVAKNIPMSTVEILLKRISEKYNVPIESFEYTPSKPVNEISDTTLQSYLGKADRQISNRLDRMSQARERLNKNYEIYDVNNPTKIIDKFEANTPELAREYYNKFIKEYNPGDQNFEFEVRRSTGLSEEGVAEGVNDYLWHGSKSKHDILYPQQANDTGGKKESNKNAIYATPSAKVAIAMGLTTPGSDTGMFPNDPQMVLFKGGIRKGEMVYLHKVPKDLFIKHNDREWYSKPGVNEVKPLEVVAVPVDKYLDLIRTATPKDLELQKKNLKKQGLPEDYLPEK